MYYFCLSESLKIQQMNKLTKDKKTGEIYLGGAVRYFREQNLKYPDYPSFERAQLKRFLATTSESVKSNFSELLCHKH